LISRGTPAISLRGRVTDALVIAANDRSRSTGRMMNASTVRAVRVAGSPTSFSGPGRSATA